MSLDVDLMALRPVSVFSANITHNLTSMANAAGIYKELWHPEDLGITTAKDLIDPLETGLCILKADPEKFVKFNPPNGWGDYEGLVSFVTKYLTACRENPDAKVETDT